MDRFFYAVVAIGLAAALTGSAHAGLLINCDQGLAERTYETSGKPAKDKIGFVWFPELQPQSTEYMAAGFCRRANSLMLPTGNNATKFSGVRLVGTDSGKVIRLPSKSAKMKNGFEKKSPIWEITDEVRELALTESSVLGYAKVKTKGTVNAGDYTQCSFGLLEVDAALLPATASAEERALAITEILRRTVRMKSEPLVP